MKLRLADGAELFYTVDDFTEPGQSRKPSCSSTAWAKNHQFWYGWVPLLAQHYRVVRFDMRGMGSRPSPNRAIPGRSTTLPRTFWACLTTWS